MVAKSTFAYLAVLHLLLLVGWCTAQFTVPDVTVEVYSPRGFRVSIPDEPGIRQFAFHANINTELKGTDPGDINKEATSARNGLWLIQDKTKRLKVGDIIYYWVSVTYDDGDASSEYTRTNVEFPVTELVADPTATARQNQKPQCERSQTTLGGQVQCKGKLLIEDTFETLNKNVWMIENRFVDKPDHEFNAFVNDPTIGRVKNGQLKIKPVLSEFKYGIGIINSNLDFGANCTGVPGSTECSRSAISYLILPPVLSSRFRSKNSIRYGRFEIRANFPKGEWIYPQLQLDPAKYEYGAGLDSGQIRIAFNQGNEMSNKRLSGGGILGSSSTARDFGMRHTESEIPWSDDFHVYSLLWTPTELIVSVDNQIYGTIRPPTGGFAASGKTFNLTAADRWKQGSTMAPFDKEMHLSVGVGVGGHVFPDEFPDKPWKNRSPKALLNFWNAKDVWGPTWNEDSALVVDYVRVWAL